MIVTCDCKDWTTEIERLIYTQKYALEREFVSSLNKPFEFCPWCGKKLVVVQS